MRATSGGQPLKPREYDYLAKEGGGASVTTRQQWTVSLRRPTCEQGSHYRGTRNLHQFGDIEMIERFMAQYRARRLLAQQSKWRSFWGALGDLHTPLP
jgi:hypothetical protein